MRFSVLSYFNCDSALDFDFYLYVSNKIGGYMQ